MLIGTTSIGGCNKKAEAKTHGEVEPGAGEARLPPARRRQCIAAPTSRALVHVAKQSMTSAQAPDHTNCIAIVFRMRRYALRESQRQSRRSSIQPSLADRFSARGADLAVKLAAGELGGRRVEGVERDSEVQLVNLVKKVLDGIIALSLV